MDWKILIERYGEGFAGLPPARSRVLGIIPIRTIWCGKNYCLSYTFLYKRMVIE
jgi:hypothetical protein